MDLTLKEALKHPATIVTSVLGTLSGIVFGDPTFMLALGGAVWSQIGTMFTASSIFAFTLAPQLGGLAWIQGPAVAFAIGAGALYVVKLANRLINGFQTRL